MQRSYTAPLARAWDRMVRMLFRPLHVETWLVLGFSAFLAGILGAGGSGFGWNLGGSHSSGRPEPSVAIDAAREHLLKLLEHPVVLMAIAIGLLALCVVMVVLAWVSSRAQFVFLDNVLRERADFLAPWGRFARLGRSLFLWGAAFSFTWLLPLVLVTAPFAGTLVHLVRGEGLVLPGLGAIVPVGLGVLVALALKFVLLLTQEFVVPLMYRHDETAWQAWGRFWPLLASHPGDFVAYALFLCVLAVGAAIAAVVAGVATCCIGLVLMLLPYLGAVVLLPVHVTGRGLGPEFLAQFGPEWNVFPAHAPETAAQPPVA